MSERDNVISGYEVSAKPRWTPKAAGVEFRIEGRGAKAETEVVVVRPTSATFMVNFGESLCEAVDTKATRTERMADEAAAAASDAALDIFFAWVGGQGSYGELETKRRIAILEKPERAAVKQGRIIFEKACSAAEISEDEIGDPPLTNWESELRAYLVAADKAEKDKKLVDRSGLGDGGAWIVDRTEEILPGIVTLGVDAAAARILSANLAAEQFRILGARYGVSGDPRRPMDYEDMLEPIVRGMVVGNRTETEFNSKREREAEKDKNDINKARRTSEEAITGEVVAGDGTLRVELVRAQALLVEDVRRLGTDLERTVEPNAGMEILGTLRQAEGGIAREVGALKAALERATRDRISDAGQLGWGIIPQSYRVLAEAELEVDELAETKEKAITAGQARTVGGVDKIVDGGVEKLKKEADSGVAQALGKKNEELHGQMEGVAVREREVLVQDEKRGGDDIDKNKNRYPPSRDIVQTVGGKFETTKNRAVAQIRVIQQAFGSTVSTFTQAERARIVGIGAGIQIQVDNVLRQFEAETQQIVNSIGGEKDKKVVEMQRASEKLMTEERRGTSWANFLRAVRGREEMAVYKKGTKELNLGAWFAERTEEEQILIEAAAAVSTACAQKVRFGPDGGIPMKEGADDVAIVTVDAKMLHTMIGNEAFIHAANEYMRGLLFHRKYQVSVEKPLGGGRVAMVDEEKCLREMNAVEMDQVRGRIQQEVMRMAGGDASLGALIEIIAFNFVYSSDWAEATHSIKSALSEELVNSLRERGDPQVGGDGNFRNLVSGEIEKQVVSSAIEVPAMDEFFHPLRAAMAERNRGFGVVREWMLTHKDYPDDQLRRELEKVFPQEKGVDIMRTVKFPIVGGGPVSAGEITLAEVILKGAAGAYAIDWSKVIKDRPISVAQKKAWIGISKFFDERHKEIKLGDKTDMRSFATLVYQAILGDLNKVDVEATSLNAEMAARVVRAQLAREKRPTLNLDFEDPYEDVFDLVSKGASGLSHTVRASIMALPNMLSGRGLEITQEQVFISELNRLIPGVKNYLP